MSLLEVEWAWKNNKYRPYLSTLDQKFARTRAEKAKFSNFSQTDFSCFIIIIIIIIIIITFKTFFC